MLHTYNCPSCKGTIQSDAEGVEQHKAECGDIAADPREAEISELTAAVQERDEAIENWRVTCDAQQRAAKEIREKLVADNATLRTDLETAQLTVKAQAALIQKLTAAPPATGDEAKSA